MFFSNRLPAVRMGWLAFPLSLAVLLSLPARGQERPRVAPIELIGRDLIVLMNSLTEGVNDPSKRLPLEPMLTRAKEAVQKTPLYQINKASEGLANARLAEAEAALLPQVQGGVSAGVRGYDATGGFAQGRYEVTQLSVDQLVYDFGSSINLRDAAADRLAATTYSAKRQESELLLTSIRLFYETQRALLQVRLSRENLQARRALVNFIRERSGLGASSVADVVRAEAQVADALDLLAASMKALTQAQARYREFYLAEAQPYVLPADIDVEDVALRDLEKYVAQHPSVLEAELKFAASRKEYEAAKAKVNGGVSLELSYSNTRNPGSSRAASDTTLLLSYKGSLYSGGADTARREQALISFEQARLDVERVKLEVTKSIRDAVAEYSGQIAGLRSRLLVFKGAEDAYAITKDLYAFSRSSLFELLRAQESLYSSGQKLIDNIIDKTLAKYQTLHETHLLLSSLERF